MRKISLAVLSAAVLLASCSSSDPQATSTTTAEPTVSSVDITPENTAICSSISAYQAKVKTAPTITGPMDEANATTLKEFFTSLEPSVADIEQKAPPALEGWVVVARSQAGVVAALDPKVEADRQAIGALIVTPSPEVTDANETLADWAATNCGVDLG